MAQLHTDVLFEGHDLTDAVLLIPENERWLFRTFTVFSAGLGSGVTYQLVNDENNATIFYGSTPLTLFSGFDLVKDIRVVLKEGGKYELSASSGADLGMYGYKLTLP